MIQTLVDAAYAYYVLNAPIMTDEEYDIIYAKVKKVNPELCDNLNLGYFEGNSTVKVKHEEPMLSIEKDNERMWEEPVVCMPKLDGVSCELVYKQGVLVYQLTRGDGRYGSDITKYKIGKVPKVLSEAYDLTVRGEVMCPNYKKYGKSHRNIVAGTLGLNDIQEAADRELTFYAYWTSLHKIMNYYTDELKLIAEEGFNVPKYWCLNPGESFDTHTKFGFPTDGIVYRYNDNNNYGEYTSHHYKNIWCWKPQGKVKETVIKSVTWKDSKNSVFTPVAVIEPVEIDETTISQVNLMSLDYVRSKDIAIGDSVLVHKAKGIIPEITQVIERPAERQNIFLEQCPKCGSDLYFEGIYLTCSNPLCSIDRQIAFFCKTVGIKGLAIKNIEKLTLQSPLTLYNLTEDELILKLGKIGETVYAEIQKSIKTTDLVTLLAALNPPKVKQSMLRKILTQVKELSDLLDYNKLIEIKGVGDIIATGLVDWTQDFYTVEYPIIQSIGFNLELPKINEDKIIGLTGTLPEKRSDFISRMSSQFNITVKTGVTKACKIVVIGDKASQAKIDKASKYGIPVVDYYEFIESLAN